MLVLDKVNINSIVYIISKLITNRKENYKLDLTNYIYIDKQYI